MACAILGGWKQRLQTQHQEVFGKELYPSVHTKAAAMIRGIIEDHLFVDGNKRTALLAGLTLLEINALKVTVASGEVEDFAVRVAVERLGVDEIAAWLERFAGQIRDICAILTVMSSKERPLFRSAMFVAIENDRGEVLLQRRANTGFLDGHWDLLRRVISNTGNRCRPVEFARPRRKWG